MIIFSTKQLSKRAFSAHRHEPLAACEKRIDIFLECFPMFVPSLSWQNDGTFWYQMARKICVSRTQRHDPVLVRVVVRHRSGRRVGVNQRAVAHKQRRPGIPAPGNIC